MKRLSLFSLLCCVLLVAGGLLVGCENQVETPVAMTLQARSAVEVLPADVQVVGMINLQDMRTNAAFDTFAPARVGGEVSARIQDFIDATGFDPETDLQEVYVAAPALDDQAAPSFVAYATFDRDRLEAFVEQNLADTFDRTNYNGITIYRATEDDHVLAFAIANENMIVGSTDVASVEAMLDRLSGAGTALDDDAETMKLIALASGGSSAWFVARDIGKHVPAAADPGKAIERDIQQIGKALQDVAVSVRIQQDGAEGTVFMLPQVGVSSSDVADLTRGVVAAMKASPDVDAYALRMLDQVKVQRLGDEVRVNFVVQNDMIHPARKG